MSGRTLFLAKPRGFCAGVVRAVDIVRRAIEVFGSSIYVRHAIVHNERVVAELEQLGAIFVEDITEVQRGSTVIFSAHGVAPLVRREAEALGLHIIDATCPLVAKVHIEVMRYEREGRHILLVGHRRHVEVVGTLGEAPNSITVVETVADVEALRLPTDQIAFVTQTTLSVDDTAEIVAAIRRRYPDVVSPPKDDICYATQNRQDAVKRMAEHDVKVVIVVSSIESSNGTRLVEVARAYGMTSHMVQSADQIEASWLTGNVGLTAAASTPDSTVQECVARIELEGYTIVELKGPEELMVFPVPPELRRAESDERRRAE